MCHDLDLVLTGNCVHTTCSKNTVSGVCNHHGEEKNVFGFYIKCRYV